MAVHLKQLWTVLNTYLMLFSNSYVVNFRVVRCIYVLLLLQELKACIWNPHPILTSKRVR